MSQYLTREQWRHMTHEYIPDFPEPPELCVERRDNEYVFYDDWTEAIGSDRRINVALTNYQEALTRFRVEQDMDPEPWFVNYAMESGFYLEADFRELLDPELWSSVRHVILGMDTTLEESDRMIRQKAIELYDADGPHTRTDSDDSYSTFTVQVPWHQSYNKIHYLRQVTTPTGSIPQLLRLYNQENPWGYKRMVKRYQKGEQVLSINATTQSQTDRFS